MSSKAANIIFSCCSLAGDGVKNPILIKAVIWMGPPGTSEPSQGIHCLAFLLFGSIHWSLIYTFPNYLVSTLRVTSGLAVHVYHFDVLTLESKFKVSDSSHACTTLMILLLKANSRKTKSGWVSRIQIIIPCYMLNFCHFKHSIDAEISSLTVRIAFVSWFFFLFFSYHLLVPLQDWLFDKRCVMPLAETERLAIAAAPQNFRKRP